MNEFIASFNAWKYLLFGDYDEQIKVRQFFIGGDFTKEEHYELAVKTNRNTLFFGLGRTFDDAYIERAKSLFKLLDGLDLTKIVN
ncbi:MAG: hypothetical protein R3321_02125 [Nitrososphaeraceae archaeon]|nr:hypothetical protein [Nitrososphaeraceae archaeon]